MKQQTHYDPQRDIMAVDPTGYVDLVKANQTSQIDVPVALQDEKFNDIEDPRSIGGRPSDEFDLMAMNKSIVDYVPPKKDGAE